MKYINIDECLSKIEQGRIDRNNDANIYLGITPKEIVLELAYSREKSDHIVLKRISFPEDRRLHEEIYVEFLVVSMIIEHSCRVRRFVDDVRKTKNRG